jgi:hypothetical protein
MSPKTARLTLAVFAAAVSSAPALARGDVWRSQGYGYLVAAEPNAVKVYDVAADRCTLSDTVPTLDALGKIEQRDRDHFVLVGDTSQMAFKRIASLPSGCLQPETINTDPLVNFDALWTIFAENYPAFAERGVDWDALRTTYRARIEALGPTGDPWPVLTELLGLLHDPHVHLIDGKRRFQARRGDAAPIGPVQEALGAYLGGPTSPLAGGVTRLAHDRLLVGLTAGRVGYVAAMTMGGFAAGPVGWPGNTTATTDQAAAHDALITAFGRLNIARGIILDLRFNPGGSEDIADLIAGCFADRRRLAYTRKARDTPRFGPSFPAFVAPNDCPRFAGPVVVLVGEGTTSAAEALVMRMRVLPQVKVVGQPTQGAHSDVLNKALPNGWKLGLSNEVYTLADGHIYEGKGIPPTIATPIASAATAEIRFGRDIDVAIRILDR